ncbi:MAG: hypothetical protein AMXMBFR74_25460 [Parvibaculum sp.]
MVAHAFVELAQDLRVEVAAEHADEHLALFIAQELEKFGKVGWPQRQNEFARLRGIGTVHRVNHRTHESRRQGVLRRFLRYMCVSRVGQARTPV